MGNAEAGGNIAGVLNILPGAARALAVHSSPVIIQLQCHANDIIAIALEQRRHHGGIDAARHGHHHARLRRRLGNVE